MMKKEILKEPTVLFENQYMLAINKPAGLMVHGDGRSTEPTLVDWIIKKYPMIESVGESFKLPSGEVLPRPGIVHRLDKETSGVMIIAKTEEAFNHFKNQFQNHEVRKTYLAFVYGEIKKERGIIDEPIGRNKADGRKRGVGSRAKGEMRPARTEFTVLKRTKEFSYVEARPLTGRTHQIRVHFRHINHPVVCDKTYAVGKPSILGFKRLALHAARIEITDPTHTALKIEAPLPDDFNAALKGH